MAYSSLEQRIAKSYLDTFPSFVPMTATPITTEDQQAFYYLIQSIYTLAYSTPTLFVATLHADDAYPNRFNKKSYQKPELQVYIKKFKLAIDAFLQKLFLLGKGEAISFTKRQKLILNQLDTIDPKNLPVAWTWMSTRPTASLIAFSHCFFDENYPYMNEVYAKLLGDEKCFKKLENWLHVHNYTRFIISNVPASDDKLSVTYANLLWNKANPKGGFEYGIKHTGISMRYDASIKEPPVIGICIPNGMKDFLLNWDKMSEHLQAFVIERTKKCNHCNYCVQTDKSGTKPKSFIVIPFNGKTYPLCTYFPGYSYCWSKLSDSVVDYIISFLSFMDQIGGY